MRKRIRKEEYICACLGKMNPGSLEVHNSSGDREAAVGMESLEMAAKLVVESAPMMPSLISPQIKKHQVYICLWPRGDVKSNPSGNPVDV